MFWQMHIKQKEKILNHLQTNNNDISMAHDP